MTALDPETRAIVLSVPGEQVVALQGFFELYEGIGTVRTLDIQRSLVCILTTATMEPTCRAVLEAIQGQINWEDREIDPAELAKMHSEDYFLGFTTKGYNVKDDS